jgi:hypothetical protein
MDPGRMVIYILVILLILTGLYYLWRWLNGSSDVQDMIIYSSSSGGMPAKSTNTTVYRGTQVPQIYPGGEYSISTWIYVTNWTVNKGLNKPFLVLSGGGGNYMTLVMYLGQFTNKLGILKLCTIIWGYLKKMLLKQKFKKPTNAGFGKGLKTDMGMEFL